MKITFALLGAWTTFFILSCNSDSNTVLDVDLFDENQKVTALIENPSGSLEKWELNKINNKIERDSINNQPRTINYLGYPANYGMIPNTLLPKNKGGDGDPLDILVLGPPVKRGSLINCKIIGLLKLLDTNEQDDKLIAIANNSSLSHINDIDELELNYKGITTIIELWFTNYKGKGKIKSLGYGNKKSALSILNTSMQEYNSAKN